MFFGPKSIAQILWVLALDGDSERMAFSLQPGFLIAESPRRSSLGDLGNSLVSGKKVGGWGQVELFGKARQSKSLR